MALLIDACPRPASGTVAACSARSSATFQACRAAPGLRAGRSTVVCNSSGGGNGGRPQASLLPMLPHLKLHKVVGHTRGRSSPWGSTLPDAHDVLPAFMERVVHKHLHAPTIIDWLDGVYIMLSRERAGEETPLAAALTPQQRADLLLPLHLEPEAGYLLLGWCLVNTRLDPRCVAIELIEVPLGVRACGAGRSLLTLLAATLPDEPVLPAYPREDSLSFWLEAAPHELGKMVDRHGVGEARQLCLGRLGWRPAFFEELLERHRATAPPPVLQSTDWA